MSRLILDAALTADDPATELQKLLDSGELSSFPEILGIIALGDANGLHKNVWDHTKAVVGGVPNLLELRWAALLHDIGKARTRKVGPKGRVTFHGHDIVGARMVVRLDKRMNLFSSDPQLASTIELLVLHHLQPAAYKKTWTDSAVRRLITHLGGPQNVEKLLTLSRADLTTKIAQKRERARARADELAARIAQIIETDSAPRLPKGTMNVVLQRSGRKPGSWLGRVQQELTSALQTNQIPTGLLPEEYAVLGLDLIDKLEI